MPRDNTVTYKDLYDAVEAMRKELSGSINDIGKQVDSLEKTVANSQGKITGLSTGISSAMAIFSFLINYFVFKRQ